METTPSKNYYDDTHEWIESEFFRGFREFDCKIRIWDGIFHANVSSDMLRELLQLPIRKKNNKSPLSNKQSGSVGWGKDSKHFLALSSDPQKYHDLWLSKLFSFVPHDDFRLSNCKEVLVDFVKRYPEYDWESHPQFKPAADKLRDYLATINQYTESNSLAECQEWIAAGLYSLICLFLQNAKIYKNNLTPQFYRPPAEYDPVGQAKSSGEAGVKTTNGQIELGEMSGDTKMPESVGLSSPEHQDLPFDFFECVRLEFEKIAHVDEDAFISDATIHMSEIASFMITPAEIHRNPISVSRALIPPVELYDTYDIGVLLVDDMLIYENGQWYILLKLRIPPYTHCCIFNREFHIESKQLDDDVGSRALFLVGGEGLPTVSPLYHLTDSQMYYLNGTDFIHENDILCLDIDEFGCLRDRRLEKMLDLYDIPRGCDSPVLQRKATVKLSPEYLHYFIVNMEDMTEIKKEQTHNPHTGVPELSITVPCPCKLAIIQTPKRKVRKETARQLLVSGYMHGLFGVERNMDHAIGYMGIAADDDPQMAFQYGAYLKKNGAFLKSAERYLRFASKSAIPGAKFELAELLRSYNTPESVEEAKQLIDELWSIGHRTYGATKSIDLFGEHQ